MREKKIFLFSFSPLSQLRANWLSKRREREMEAASSRYFGISDVCLEFSICWLALSPYQTLLMQAAVSIAIPMQTQTTEERETCFPPFQTNKKCNLTYVAMQGKKTLFLSVFALTLPQFHTFRSKKRKKVFSPDLFLIDA